jgi:hypothetical protein
MPPQRALSAPAEGTGALTSWFTCEIIDCLLRILSIYPDKAAQMSIDLPLVLRSVKTPFSSTV